MVDRKESYVISILENGDWRDMEFHARVNRARLAMLRYMREKYGRPVRVTNVNTGAVISYYDPEFSRAKGQKGRTEGQERIIKREPNKEKQECPLCGQWYMTEALAKNCSYVPCPFWPPMEKLPAKGEVK